MFLLGWEDCKKSDIIGEIVSSAHDRTAAPMNLRRLWLLAQDLQKVKPGNILTWREEGLMSPAPYPRNCGQWMALEEGMSAFFKGVVPS